MDALEYIVNKYSVDLNQEFPIYIDKTREDLALLFKELGFNTGVEIGVLEGHYSEVLCQANPQLKLYSVDAWLYYPVPNNYRLQRHYNQAYEAAKERLAQYPNNTIIKKWSMDASKDFEDGSIDFVFIDGDHAFQAITNDIAEWSKKVRTGGIVSAIEDTQDHVDFGRSKYKSWGGVKDVVLAWTNNYDIKPWFVFEPDKYKDNRDSLERRDSCWFWVKE